MKIEQKILIKEDEGLSTPKPFNKYTASDTEKTIEKVLEKEFKDYALELYQHQGETQYVNLILSTELKEVQNDLEFKRYVISKLIADFRQSFFTELSRYLNVVNITTGSYQFVKGSDRIKFSITVLMSNNNISDWVSGVKKKTESNKDLVKESKDNKKISESTYCPTDDYDKKQKEIMDMLWQGEMPGIHNKYTNGLQNCTNNNNDIFNDISGKNKKTGMTNESNIKNILTVIHSQVLKETKSVDTSFSKNVLNVKESKGTKVVNVKDASKISSILKKLHEQVLAEAKPDSAVAEPEKETVAAPMQLDTKTEKSLQKKIIEFNELQKEIEAIELQQAKELERRQLKRTKLAEAIEATMKSVNMNLYIVDEIVAKIPVDFERASPKYAKMFEEVEETLGSVNEKTRKLLQEIRKKHTKKTTVYGTLSVDELEKGKGKNKKNESVIKEGIGDIFKSIYYAFKNYLTGLTTARKKMQQLAHQLNLI